MEHTGNSVGGYEGQTPYDNKRDVKMVSCFYCERTIPDNEAHRLLKGDGWACDDSVGCEKAEEDDEDEEEDISELTNRAHEHAEGMER